MSIIFFFSSCKIYIGDGIGYILNFCFFFIVGLFIARNLTRLHGMKLGTRVQERQITFCKQNIKELQYYIIIGGGIWIVLDLFVSVYNKRGDGKKRQAIYRDCYQV